MSSDTKVDLSSLAPAPADVSAEIPGFGRLDEERAKSVATMEAYSTMRELVDSAPVGFWVGVPIQMGGPVVSPKPMPPQWHFVRLGRQGAASTYANEQTYKAMGYRKAPPMVRCSGFAADHNDGVYYCAPPEVYMRGRALKMVAAKLRASHADELEKSLASFGVKGVNAEVTYAEEGTGSLEDINAAVQAQVRKRGSKR